RRLRGGDARGGPCHRREGRDHRSRADDQARAWSGRGAGRLGRRTRRRRPGGAGGSGGERADHRPPRIRGVPAGDGGRAHPPRDRSSRRARTRRVRPCPSQPLPARSRMRVPLTVTVNGVSYPLEVEPDTTLLRAVREHVGLTGAKEGCDDSECGACMMLLDGRPVNACSYLALQAEGRAVTTVEGLATDGGLDPLQQAFLEHGGVQCGFCTPGMLISATALLAKHPNPTEDEVRVGLSGNLCRCTGYDGIVKAVLDVAAARR